MLQANRPLVVVRKCCYFCCLCKYGAKRQLQEPSRDDSGGWLTNIIANYTPKPVCQPAARCTNRPALKSAMHSTCKQAGARADCIMAGVCVALGRKKASVCIVYRIAVFGGLHTTNNNNETK